MTTIFQTAYPLYNNIGNFSGGNGAVKSAAHVNSSATHDAGAARQNVGRLGLAQFGFIQLPREVLFLHDEKGAKVKATREADHVQAVSKTELDADRGLDRIKAANEARAEQKAERTRQNEDNHAELARQARKEKQERAQAPNEFLIQQEKTREIQLQQETADTRDAGKEIDQHNADMRQVQAALRDASKQKDEAAAAVAEERSKPVLETGAQTIEREKEATEEAIAAAERRKPPSETVAEKAAEKKDEAKATLARVEKRKELLNPESFARRAAEDDMALTERIAEDQRHVPPPAESVAQIIVDRANEYFIINLQLASPRLIFSGLLDAEVIKEAPLRGQIEESHKARINAYVSAGDGAAGPASGKKLNVKA